jgi:steroid 5-alpha reductase family enzyme
LSLNPKLCILDPNPEPRTSPAPTLASSDKPWRLALGALSPLFISTLLLFVSGVNLAEARNDEKYGALAEYQAYKSKTPLLFPFF